MFVSHFYLLSDERKGRKSARVSCRKKRGRENSDPNGVCLYKFIMKKVMLIIFIAFSTFSALKMIMSVCKLSEFSIFSI